MTSTHSTTYLCYLSLSLDPHPMKPMSLSLVSSFLRNPFFSIPTTTPFPPPSCQICTILDTPWSVTTRTRCRHRISCQPPHDVCSNGFRLFGSCIYSRIYFMLLHGPISWLLIQLWIHGWREWKVRKVILRTWNLRQWQR